MIGRRKIATVSGLLGALAVIYGGATQAYADEPSGECTLNGQGDIICVKKSEVVHKDKDGKHVIKQKQNCETIERPRFVFSDGHLLNGGATKVGPEVECSNKAELPKGYKLPEFKF
ncbi:hypothetical protein SSP24_49000 [Streptomyces spinoverrucosus]|uniref:Lipoprotein n=2 Tax=Streptomyces spinoverrucosus TaxID=284043 RepID=A0A4Y3VM79_9ACTN|nr:hypothetical protein SSP24_49000 [Streptomyces spinoverrucosus]GHB90725.1 hypothetical protein GCM10010397_73670 [Streptomyces spinoverrucosus]